MIDLAGMKDKPSADISVGEMVEYSVSNSAGRKAVRLGRKTVEQMAEMTVETMACMMVVDLAESSVDEMVEPKVACWVVRLDKM